MKQLHIIRRIKYSLGCYRKRTNNKRIYNLRIFYLIIFTIFFVIVVYNCSSRLCSFALLTGKDKLKNEITKDCSAIVSTLIWEHNLTYESMVTANTGENGKINSISTDFYKINMFKSSLEQQLTDKINSHNRIICRVPVGAAVFDNIFTAWGTEIPTLLLTSSSLSVEFYDEFTEAGINQTKHSIILKIIVNSKIHTMLKSTSEEIRLDIPVAETIIVDNVPTFVFPLSSTE